MKVVFITTGLLITLMAIAVIAPGASAYGKKHNKPKDQPAEPSASLIAQGHTVFLTNCAPCHGADAQGDDGPKLVKKGLPDSVITEAVAHGFQGEMPAFGAKLKPADQTAVVAYVHSVQK